METATILVPVRYPLRSASVATLERALDLATDYEPAHIYVLHVNLLHRGRHVGRDDLARAVEAEFGHLENASYHVRDAFLLEEAILYEAVQQDADHVVVGTNTRSQWRKVLATRLGVDVDLEAFLQRHLGAKLLVVREPRVESRSRDRPVRRQRAAETPSDPRPVRRPPY